MEGPLFLQSQMHKKIWGGNRLRKEFGYDIPSETTENIGRFLRIPMECLLLKWCL